MSDELRPIIKKVKKVDGHGHHGGAWKVAYADFVTAMMAFFLMMWLLSSTSEEQKRGISNYFGPTGQLTGAGGSGGVLAGLTISSEGLLEDDSTRGDGQTDGQHHGKKAFEETPKESEESGENLPETMISEDLDSSLLNSTTPKQSKKLEEEQKEKLNEQEQAIEKMEKEMFKEVEEAIKQAVQEDPDLKDLAKNLIIDETPEGLRIQIVDRENTSMFKLGQYEPLPHTVKLIHLVGKIIKKLPNKVSVTGHTDGKPYSRKDYTNWELSADRANAARRYLIAYGVGENRLIYVTGKADKDHLVKDDPFSPINRRISMILHRMGSAPYPSAFAKRKNLNSQTKQP